MAISFIKDILTTKLLTAYNNNVVRFKSDSVDIPKNANISGMGIDVLLYPHPDGSFYFNFKDYISTEINTKNFNDTIESDLDVEDEDTFTYNVSDGCYLQGDITFKINFETTYETIVRNLSFVAGVEQLEQARKGETLSDNDFIILSPVAPRTNNTNYLKYWIGYPFEFSYYSKDEFAILNLKNISNGFDSDFQTKGKVTSLFITDGRPEVTIDDFLPLILGYNNIQLFKAGENQNVNLTIDKVDSDCGVYIKFLNQYGRWNYWLLSKYNTRARTTKYIAELDNDFSNLEDTISPTLQTGKIGNETLRCAAEKLDQNERTVFEGIIDSPKIYLFTGLRFTKVTLSDWMEISLKTSSIKTVDTKRNKITFVVEFDLPNRYTQTL